METKTIKTIVSYSLNQKGQKAMAKLGLPAQQKQKTTMTLPLNTHGLSINREGMGELEFDYEHEPLLTSEYIAVPDELQGGKDLPWLYHKKATAWTNSHYGISTPLLTPQDVLIHIANEQAKVENVTSLLTAKQAEYDAEYESGVIAQKARIQHLADVTEARKQLENEYQNALCKLTQINDLIDGKQRIRTAQILTIIES